MSIAALIEKNLKKTTEGHYILSDFERHYGRKPDGADMLVNTNIGKTVLRVVRYGLPLPILALQFAGNPLLLMLSAIATSGIAFLGTPYLAAGAALKPSGRKYVTAGLAASRTLLPAFAAAALAGAGAISQQVVIAEASSVKISKSDVCASNTGTVRVTSGKKIVDFNCGTSATVSTAQLCQGKTAANGKAPLYVDVGPERFSCKP